MSDFVQCPRCRKWDWLNKHVCPPIYLVWDPDYEESEENAKTIHANSLEKAAIRYAEDKLWNGCGNTKDSWVVLAKKLTDNGPPKKLEVHWEMAPSFWVEEPEADDA
jgi:hypothetical protein